jgi:chromate transporter
MIYLNLFFTFFKIGLFTFGGGYAMIPLIQQEVIGQQWLTMSELSDFIAIAQSTPGAFAVNIATFVGMERAGFLGALITATAVASASFIIIILIAKVFSNFLGNRWIQGLLFGMRPVVIALIASAAVLLMINGFIIKDADVHSLTEFFAALRYKELLIFGICCGLQFKLKLHPIQLILTSAGLGILFFGVLPIFL